jgi:antitoxin component YwqK of YwqJK toxin-antitoxin module
MLSTGIQAQSDTIFNQTDANNHKQGFWKKNYPNGKLMYKGFFKDDKPVGEMRRFFESGSLKAILTYNASGEYARATLYYQDGNIAARGNYFTSLKDSTWVYYSFYDHSITARETFVKGVRDGMTINYYNSGEPSELVEWKNNKKSGIWEQYYKGNLPKLKAHYTDNKLDGEYVVYYVTGKPQITGLYKNGLQEGKWTLYNEDGSVKSLLTYNSGKAAEQEKVNADQQEFFRLIDEAKGKYKEPDETDFLSPQTP